MRMMKYMVVFSILSFSFLSNAQEFKLDSKDIKKIIEVTVFDGSKVDSKDITHIEFNIKKPTLVDYVELSDGKIIDRTDIVNIRLNRVNNTARVLTSGEGSGG